MSASDDLRRQLPAVDAVLKHRILSDLSKNVSPGILTAIAREVVADARRKLVSKKTLPSLDQLALEVRQRLEKLCRAGPRRAINATGVVLHTGLGRASLSAAAAQAVHGATGYCNLEINLQTGERGDRQEHVETLLRLLTGAEAAMVVNNNAAALYLALNVLAHRREAIASRGQLIEIGGSFRLPDIMQRSGVHLVEVGTTNRTRIEDFREAITSRTALLLHAHPSNYRIVGFSESVPLSELVGLGRERNLTVVEDLGNGLLFDWSDLGLPAEENVCSSLEAGADLVLVSGDKVLGGPQAGVILGKRDLVLRLKKSALARVLRVDKLILAGLAATLQAYLDRRRVPDEIPVWRMLTALQEALESRAALLCKRLQPLTKWTVLDTRPCTSEAGSGTLPAVNLPSHALCALPEGRKATAWSAQLRGSEIPVVGTIRQDIVWFDMRTISDGDLEDFVRMIAQSVKER